jgi:outer membrane receptor protein involved in Fe transport
LKSFVAALLLICWTQVLAAEKPPDDTEELFDAEWEMLAEQEVVLTAAKHKQKAGFSPSAVIVITRRDIEESGATSLLDLLRLYPAVHVYITDPLYPSAMIRGTIRALLAIDGREVNLEIYPAPFYALVPISIHQIERIEIVLGPNSALYGANAVSTVINIATRKPTADLHADLSVATGEHGNTLLEGLLEGGLALQGVFSIDRAASWMDRESISRDLIRSNLTMRLKLGQGDLTASGGILSGGGRFFGLMGYMDFDRMLLANCQLEFERGDLKTRLYWYGFRGTFDLELDLVHPDTNIELGDTPLFVFSGDTFQAEAQYDFSLFADNLLIAGADFRVTSLRSDQIVNPEILDYRFGIFLHDEQRFLEKLLLTLGARFDWNNLTDPAVSPRAALVYNPAGEHFLRLSGAMAFRKPTLLETSINFRVNENAAFPEIKALFEQKGISNPGLDNEILTGFELGYRGSVLDRVLRFGADVYLDMNRNWVSFNTDFVFRPPFNVQIDVENSKVGYVNSEDDFNVLGCNFFVEGEPLEYLTLFLRGEYRHEWQPGGTKTAGKVPSYQGSAGGTLRLPFGLIIHLAAVHVAGRRDNVRDPQSILAPSIWQDLPALTYLLANVVWRLEAGPSRIDLGLSLFNPFGGRFREKAGVRAPDGSNYGGEWIGTRAMLTARFQY